MNVNRWKDFAERVIWTAVYAAASAGLVAMSTDDITWETGLKLVGSATLMACLKVIVAQNVGERGSGDAIPGGVRQ